MLLFPPGLEIELHQTLVLPACKVRQIKLPFHGWRLRGGNWDSPLSFLANTNDKYLTVMFAGLTVLTVEASWRTTTHHWGWPWQYSSSPSGSSSAAPWRRSSVSFATGASPRRREERWQHILNQRQSHYYPPPPGPRSFTPPFLSWHARSSLISAPPWLPTTNIWYWTCKSSE